VEFTKDELQFLKDIESDTQIRNIDPIESPELFCKEVKRLSLYKIPPRIQDIFTDFSRNGNKDGVLLVRGLPILYKDEDYSSFYTPPINTESVGSTTLLARLQAVLMSLLGEMISYEAEGGGRLFQDLVPVKNMETKQTSYSSNIELEIHTEQAFSELRPDILSLACVRGDEKAMTYILPVERILENLHSNEDRLLLLQPMWEMGVDLSFQVNGHVFLQGMVRGPVPMIRHLDTFPRPLLTFDQDLMKGTTTESQKIIPKIVDIYHQHRTTYCLKSGDILFLDNRCAVHGRSSFQPIYDGLDRFLIRCFATTDYEKSRHAREGRMVRAIYS